MTKDQEFKQEFFALLRKYNAEMYIHQDIKFKPFVSFSFDWNISGESLTKDLDVGNCCNGKEFV